MIAKLGNGYRVSPKSLELWTNGKCGELAMRNGCSMVLRLSEVIFATIRARLELREYACECDTAIDTHIEV